MTVWDWTAILFVLFFFFLLYFWCKQMAASLASPRSRGNTSPQGDKRKEGEMVRDRLSNGNWGFPCIIDADGKPQPRNESAVIAALLQDIRNDQRDHRAALEENIEATKELLAYLKSVFG